ncbi:hypothetical protein C8Q77DRAFT_1161207 [Trametes polyzona]|nr:hypothetical protein C8Q77DRAFT_1161207 [Trametes polyzona]
MSSTDPVAFADVHSNVSCPSPVAVHKIAPATQPGVAPVSEPTALPVASSIVSIVSSIVPVTSAIVPVASSVVPGVSTILPAACALPAASPTVPSASPTVPSALPALPVASPALPVVLPALPVASPAFPVTSSIAPVALPALPVTSSVALLSPTAYVASAGAPSLSPTAPVTPSTTPITTMAVVSAAPSVSTATPPAMHGTSPTGVSGPSPTALPSAPSGLAVKSPITISYGPTSCVIAQPPAPTKRKEAPKIPAAQHAAITAASRNKQQQLQQELDTWYDGVQQFAAQLAERYGHKPEHYMNLLFSGGAKMRKERKPNAYNAWSYAIAKEINEDAEPGDAQHLLSMQSERIDEYHALTAQEKAKYIEQLQEERQSQKFGTRLTHEEIEKMLYALKNRTGVEAFVCIVRNNNEFHAPPYWYFTDMRLDCFLRGRIRGWDCVTIASLSEAFSVAGCDFASYYTTSKAKADHFKAEIRDRIREMLCTETGNKKAVMNYVNHELNVVLRYGVELVGYHASFVNPSSLTSSLPTLRNLLAAIDDGTCHF